jgi:polyphosphate kinase
MAEIIRKNGNGKESSIAKVIPSKIENVENGNVEASSKEKGVESIPLDDPSLFINRELGWVDLNTRILEEACDNTHPLLERIKFLAICGGNLDEFFMVRVSALKRQILKGALKAPPDKMTPTEQLTAIRARVKPMLKKYSEVWNESLIPDLSKHGITIPRIKDLSNEEREAVRKFFKKNIYPTLTPLAMDFAHPFPFISNLSLNLAIMIQDPTKGQKYARVKVPVRLFGRFIDLSEIKIKKKSGNRKKKAHSFVILEDIVASNIDLLFPGLEVTGVFPFRVTRNAEYEIQMYKAPDLLTAVEEGVESRRIGFPIRLQVEDSMPNDVKNLLARNLKLTNDNVYRFDGPLGLIDLWQFLKIDRPDLKDEPFLPCTPNALSEESDIFEALERRDWIVYYPYDSFETMLNLLKQAAEDPDVLAIKTTMYRIDKSSPVVESLMRARNNGKAVAVLVELKAKFDEIANINWTRSMEEAGVHVVYGLEDLKVHAKILLIVRKRGNELIRYSLISTGNFNAVTSEIYADMSYLTTNEAVGVELTEVFNSLTGYSEVENYKNLIVAPKTLRKEITQRIRREIEFQKSNNNGYIAMKLNGLTDRAIVQELYKASQAGVKIDLNVRALCRLRPGVPGVSENISEISIIGRFLEHARIYYFHNNGKEDVLTGSADLMERNLDRRVEVLMEIPDPEIKQEIIDHMLKIHLKDNVKARKLNTDGTWERVKVGNKEKPFNSQQWLIENRGIWHGNDK